MAKPLTKPSDRGRNNPEPGDTPGTRATQRDTGSQISGTAVMEDPAVEWERSEQDKLPPRGTGSQQNQGPDHGPTVAEVGDEVAVNRDVARDDPDSKGMQTGGTRGPSNEANTGSGR